MALLSTTKRMELSFLVTEKPRPVRLNQLQDFCLTVNVVGLLVMVSGRMVNDALEEVIVLGGKMLFA